MAAEVGFGLVWRGSSCCRRRSSSRAAAPASGWGERPRGERVRWVPKVGWELGVPGRLEAGKGPEWVGVRARVDAAMRTEGGRVGRGGFFVLQSSGSAQSYKCESQRADEGHGPIRRRLVLELGVVCDEAAGSAATMQGGRLQFLALQPRRCGRQQETMQVETARMARSKRRCSAAEQRCEGRDGRWSGHSRCDGSSNLEEGWSAAPQRGRVRL